MLQFSPAVVSRVKESTWHPLQVMDDLEDGGCLLTVRVAETREMIPWIRSWGPDVKVLEPPALRAEIATDARRAAAVYDKGSPAA